jgi:CPA2 family monovalent cation:H+ antiporter-2
MVAATLMGAGAGMALGMPLAEAVILGVALSIASTIVFMRVMEERRLIKSEEGRIGISWLLVEDLVVVLAIVVLPALVAAMATGGAIAPAALLSALGITFVKIAAFIALMLVIGGRFFPWLIVQIAHAKSRELLSLGTLALALGVAWAAYYWFDASFALGAFLAGLALNGSKFSHRVAEESLPLRDTFAVIFFVAVGMLFNPTVLIEAPLAVAAIVFVIIAGKAILGYIPMRMLGQSHEASLLIALGTAQIGEFSFVLAGLGVQLNVMSMETYSLILAGSIISIALNPILMRLVPHITPHPEVKPEPARASA